MKLTIINSQQYGIKAKPQLDRICQLVDENVGKISGIVNIVFCDDPTIRRLNRDYRGKDKVTDVLTFTYFESAHPSTIGPRELLGEVVLSIPQTKRQAKEEGWPVIMEVYKLCIHGLLHLRGYDHEEEEDFRVMKLLEDKIMKKLIDEIKS